MGREGLLSEGERGLSLSDPLRLLPLRDPEEEDRDLDREEVLDLDEDRDREEGRELGLYDREDEREDREDLDRDDRDALVAEEYREEEALLELRDVGEGCLEE
jgi:hypothetical protein